MRNPVPIVAKNVKKSVVFEIQTPEALLKSTHMLRTKNLSGEVENEILLQNFIFLLFQLLAQIMLTKYDLCS